MSEIHEELWDQSYSTTKKLNRLTERVNQLEKENIRLTERIGSLADWLRADSDLTRSLMETVEAQAARIERLEAIIVSMGRGYESNPPDGGDSHTYNLHTHRVYPLNGVTDLVDEIEDEWAAERKLAEEQGRLTEEQAWAWIEDVEGREY